MPRFICPVCRGELAITERTLRCPSGHCFDMSKEGYVNLLVSRQTARQRGDDRAMIRARRDFLSLGRYDPLSREICTLAEKHCPHVRDIVDCGCGEGKYLEDLTGYLEGRGAAVSVCAVDISKAAAAFAAKRLKKASVAVASSSRLPLRDGCADLVLSVFAPFFAREFARVLAVGGAIIRAYPLRRHLIELKRLVYDTPLENPDADMAESGLRIVETRELEYTFEVHSREELENLFMMTPYAHKTSERDIKKLNGVCALEVTAHFGATVYKKI